MMTDDQVVKIHTHAQTLFSTCPPDLLEHVLSILEVTEPLVKAQAFVWTEEADGSHTLAYQGQKMGRVYPATYRGHEVYRGVILHTYDPASDTDETFVCNNGFLEYAKREVQGVVKSIVETREKGGLLHV